MLSTDKAWAKWGRDDPYYGVLADQRFSTANIDASRDEFFATGRSVVADFLARYQRQFGTLPRGRALDHGCGVGRMSLPLAAHFAEVIALDVAPAMLDEARGNAAAADTANIRFELADDALSNADGMFDLVNSFIVLQHIPVRRGLTIIDALLDRVAPGGGFHIHVSLRTDRGGPRWLYWASANLPGVKIWQNICAGRTWNAPAMQMNHYSLGDILVRLAARGIGDVLVRTNVQPRFATCSLLGRAPGVTPPQPSAPGA